MGFMLYGNDIDDTTTPLEAGLAWTVKLAKPDFNGRAALVAQKERGLARKLVAFDLDGRRVPRHDMAIEHGGRAVGRVTSGTFGPSLGRPLGMGYVETAAAVMGGDLDIVAGGVKLPARIVKLPFYKNGSRRMG
jgi:aminomethyltransferase